MLLKSSLLLDFSLCNVLSYLYLFLLFSKALSPENWTRRPIKTSARIRKEGKGIWIKSEIIKTQITKLNQTVDISNWLSQYSWSIWAVIMRYIYLCMQSVKVVILSMSTVAKFLCSDLNLFLFFRVPDIIQKATYQKRLKRRYDAVFIQIPPLN